MTTAQERIEMARVIVGFEARRDSKGRLIVYPLPPEDGGGRYEVAGINERYNKETCDVLVKLIDQGKYEQAERLAEDFIAQKTDSVESWSEVPALEFWFRDCCFNRGFSGSGRILQRAVGTKDDGVVGEKTRAALAKAEKNVDKLLDALRAARERYELDVVGYREKFWKGLTNRWNKALKAALKFPMTPT